LRLSDFDYELPPDRIAQEPLSGRDASRLMVLDRTSGSLDHRVFSALPDLMAPGDLLVLNDTRVIPARLWGKRADAGASARVETLLVERVPEREPAESGARARSTQVWRVMLRGSRRPDERIDFGSGLTARVIAREDGAFHLIALTPPAGQSAQEAIESRGLMPVPPYIHRGSPDDPPDPRIAMDGERYQTVFASSPGAIAAPTAGLHFTPALLDRLRARGVGVESLTLHVGPGTFLPVRDEDLDKHELRPEAFAIPGRLCQAIARARAEGGRVVAVGTTVTRALESQATPDGNVAPGTGRCALFIRPGHAFRVVDGLITNFHLPRSTLLMLVAAFAGRERVLAAYAEAVRLEYRFYSYGDAMLLR